MALCHLVLPSFLVSKPMTNARYPEISYTHEEGFTGTWAYDQIWASLRRYSMTRAGDGKVFKFKQTGYKSSDPIYTYCITGFEFGPEGDKPVFGLVVRHYDYARRTKLGIAVGDNKAFVVSLPGRKSFSPNVAFHTGKMRSGYYFGAPVFAIEVRNGLDYSNDSYGRMFAKTKDYFSAGTQVVWDVDVLVDGVVWVYRKDNPDKPVVYRRGEKAEAEPALLEWSMPVDDLFYPYADDIEE